MYCSSLLGRPSEVLTSERLQPDIIIFYKTVRSQVECLSYRGSDTQTHNYDPPEYAKIEWNLISSVRSAQASQIIRLPKALRSYALTGHPSLLNQAQAKRVGSLGWEQ